MKKILAVAGIITVVLAARIHASEYPQYQNMGAVQYTTMTAVSASTTPAILISTGSNTVADRGHSAGPVSVVASSPTSVTGLLEGQYMKNRIYMEIFNDTAYNIWIGYDASVSTMPGEHYGRRISTGTAWANDGAIRDYWVVAATTTRRQIVVTQQK